MIMSPVNLVGVLSEGTVYLVHPCKAANLVRLQDTLTCGNGVRRKRLHYLPIDRTIAAVH